MNKSFYNVAILFMIVTTIAGFFESIILMLVGHTMIYLQPYASWLLVSGIVKLCAAALAVRYFHARQWKFVFVTGMIFLAVLVIQLVSSYIILITVNRESPLPPVTSLLNMVCSVVVAGGLIFSAARSNKWMVTLGILMALLNIGSLVTTVAAYTVLQPISVMRIFSWITLAGSLLPIFYIVAFVQERKNASEQAAQTSRSETLGYAFALTGMLAVAIVGGQLGKEGYWHVHWQSRKPEETRKLLKRFEVRNYVDSRGDTLHYLLMRPVDYDSAQKYPLVTCLHGGPVMTPGSIEVAEPAQVLSKDENRKKYPAFIFVPQAGAGVLWGGIKNIPSAENRLLEAMAALEQEFSIDDKRRYIAGTSGGGYGTWHLISTHPDMFAAAMPMCGAGDPSLAKKITHVPVWAFHGEVDRNVPVSGSRDMIEAIRTAGGNPKYNEYAGVGHHVWPEVSKTEGVLDWMFAQRRE